MARFFIDRPIFAWVIAIMVMLAGALAIRTLPVAQYPAIAPPVISIQSYYPGANAKTLEDSVTQVIEQKMNGIDHLRYMASTSDSSGNAAVTLTFDAGTNPDVAQMQVQNKLQLAMPLLPQEVQKQGVRVQKAVNNFLLIAAFVSTDGSMNRYDLSDFVASSIQDPLSRVPGVGDTQLFGSQYAMRIWLDADKLRSYGLTALDVTNAVLAQNVQVSAGQLGGAPAVPGQQLNATITAQSRLKSIEEFKAVQVRVNPDGSTVRLGDVARLELGGESFEIQSFYNGAPAGGIGVKLATGANALDTSKAVRAKIADLQRYFPPGVEVRYPVDTSPFVKLSIEEVVKTLIEAIVLVFLVMFLFLQNFRATLIPTIAVPVVLLGTFGILAAFGFSINTLTMFGLVLAIGLLVDDAIVVVENVERVMSEEGLPPKEATRKSMDQITGALVGITLVLSAVFIPMAFFGGSVGVIYRQFSITLVSAMALSVVVAMTLTPALCATILAPVEKGHGMKRKGFFGWFNRSYDAGSRQYQGVVGWVLNHRGRALLVYAAIVVVLGLALSRLPGAFLPEEDQGAMLAQVALPPGSTLERTTAVMKRVSDHFLVDEKDAVEGVMTIVGFNFAGRGQNAGIAFVKLKDWDERKDARLKAKAVAGRAMMAFSRIKEAMVFAFVPPAVQELGNATGFDMQLQDRGNVGHEKLLEARNMLLGMSAKEPAITKVRPNGQDDTPQFKLDIDHQRAAALSVNLGDINNTLASTWGASYVNDFVDRGRVKRVYMQADAPFRMKPEDLDRWYVRNTKGEMVPFTSFSAGSWTYGSPRLERFNGLSSMEVVGEPSPGTSTGEAMATMERLVAKLPPGVGLDWTGISYEERLSGANAPALYAISMLVVFLALAALYESWSIPISVILVVPLGVLGAVLAAMARGFANDVYFQVALLTTIGLSAKNAILIVEFAKAEHDRGRDILEATIDAARMRLRPIIMTSLAFVLGVLPLAIANGAGSNSQNAIGTGVIGGVVAATVLGVLLIPVFFVSIVRLFDRRKRPHAVATPAPAEGGELHG